MDDESKQMHVDSLNVQVSNHQSLKDCLPVIKHAGSSGNGFPYAPEDFPSPGDVWTWRVGKRYTHAGFWQDRSVQPPDRLQSSMGGKMSFHGRTSLEQYIRKTFPDADIDAFFDSFVWKIPCTDVAKDASLKAIKSKGCSKSAAAIIRPGNCKVSNEMCHIKAETDSSLTPATCNICCSVPNFCRYCCCILCSKAIDWIYDGYSFIKCEALVDEKFICGHVAHIECALRAYLAGKVGGSIDLDTQYYCRRCDNRTDLLLHVEKIVKVSESIDNRDDTMKVLNLGFCMLRGSEKERAGKLRNHIATSTEKLKHGVSSEDICQKRSEISELEQGAMGEDWISGFSKHTSRSRYTSEPHHEFEAERQRRKSRERENARRAERKDSRKRKREAEKGHSKEPNKKHHSESSERPKALSPASVPPSNGAPSHIVETSKEPGGSLEQTSLSKLSLGPLPPGLARLQADQPSLFLYGLRFDQEVHLLTRADVEEQVRIVQRNADTVFAWKRLCHQLSDVYKKAFLNLQAAEKDNIEREKTIKERDEGLLKVTRERDETLKQKETIDNLMTELKRAQAAAEVFMSNELKKSVNEAERYKLEVEAQKLELERVKKELQDMKAEKDKLEVDVIFVQLKHGIPSEDICQKRNEISKLEQGTRWVCNKCKNFQLCEKCYDTEQRLDVREMHPINSRDNRDLSPVEITDVSPDTKDKDKMLELLVHASQCRSPSCRYRNCRKVKDLFRHGINCKVCATGGCLLCKKMWYLLQLHARACKESECHVPRCKDLKDRLRNCSSNPIQDVGLQ